MGGGVTLFADVFDNFVSTPLKLRQTRERKSQPLWYSTLFEITLAINC